MALLCEVCDKNPVVGVCSIPGMPMSAGFCKECLQTNAIPYWAAVANTAIIGGLAEAAPWWIQIVEATLLHLNKSKEQFESDVKTSMADLPHPGPDFIEDDLLDNPSDLV